MPDLELKEKLEKVAELVKPFQEKFEALELEGKTNSEELVKIGADIGKFSEEFQELKTLQDAEIKAREALELTLSRAGSDKSAEDIKSVPEYVAQFDNYMRSKSAIDPEIMDQEFKAIVESTGAKISDEKLNGLKTLLVGSDPDGGFFVPVDMQSKIIKRVFETSPMRNIASVISTGTEAVEFPLDDGQFSSGWVAEMDTRTETDTSQVGIITIPVHEQYAEPKATQKMLDDSVFNIEQWVQEKITSKFARTENTAFVNGTGIKQPTGFNQYASWATAAQYEREALETRSTAASNVIAGDDLLNVQSDLLEPYQAGAVWAMHRKIWVEVLKLKDSDNNYLLNPAMLFGGSLGLQMLGKPVVLFGDMPSTLADNAKAIAYGDFAEGYTVVDRIGIRVLRDNLTSKGFVKFYTTKRTGGDVTNYQAIKRLLIKAAA